MSTAAEIIACIESHRFDTSVEERLQNGIEEALTRGEIAFTREHRLDDRSRVDFMAGSVAIEVKIDGPASAVLRQLHRYAGHPQVEVLLLVTTKARHTSMPPELAGKPVFVCWLKGSTL